MQRISPNMMLLYRRVLLQGVGVSSISTTMLAGMAGLLAKGVWRIGNLRVCGVSLRRSIRGREGGDGIDE